MEVGLIGAEAVIVCRFRSPGLAWSNEQKRLRDPGIKSSLERFRARQLEQLERLKRLERAPVVERWNHWNRLLLR
jgi:hypothetical protein